MPDLPSIDILTVNRPSLHSSLIILLITKDQGCEIIVVFFGKIFLSFSLICFEEILNYTPFGPSACCFYMFGAKKNVLTIFSEPKFLKTLLLLLYG